jgi:ABC-type multidrug transport system permease subunit
MRAHARVVWVLMRRGLNEILRVPGAALPGVLAPTIFMIGLSGVFGAAARLRGFPAVEGFRTYIVPVGLLQGAGFTGAATGVNLARDIEQGWFDRLLVAPVPRVVLLLGTVLSASLRALLPASLLLAVGFALGVRWPGVGGLLLALLFVSSMAAVAACWGITLALRFRTQQAAPLIQVVTFASILLTTAYAPKGLLQPWLRHVSDFNPVNHVLIGVRQGFLADVTWADTWPALLAVLGLASLLGYLAVRGLRRSGA